MKPVKIIETFQANLNINESADGLVHMTGLFGETGTRNRNGRVYSKENYGAMVESLQPQIQKGLLGELEHPYSLNIDLNRVSHKIDSLQMNEDGTCTGEITLLNTAQGKQAQALVEAGIPIYVSSRGAGSIDEDGNVTLERLVTWDIVSTPSVENARFDVKESVCECIDEGLFIISENDSEGKSVDEKEEPKDEPEKKEEAKEEEPKDEPKDEEPKDEPKDDEPKDDEPKDDKKNDEEDDNKKEESLEEKKEEEQIKEDTHKYIYKNTMKKINLSEIILAKKNGTNLSEGLQNVLDETKKELFDATNMSIEGFAVPFNLLEAEGDAEPILSPVAIAQPSTVDNIGALNATITDINGKSTIHTEYQSMLAPIFNNNVLSAFDLMTGLRGNVEIPRYGGVSAYWKGELKKAGESTMKFDAIEVKPKRLTVFVDLSNQLLMQSAYNVEAYVREQMILAISRKLQETILGDGAGDDVTPAGLFYDAETLDALTYANLVEIEKDAEEQNVTGNLGYIINPAIKAEARTTLKSEVAGAQYLYDNAELIGQPTWVTNDAAGLLFGDLKQVLICVWGNGIDMKVDTTTLAQYDATRLVVNFYVDVVNRAPLTGEAEEATPVKNIFPFIMGE